MRGRGGGGDGVAGREFGGGVEEGYEKEGKREREEEGEKRVARGGGSGGV